MVDETTIEIDGEQYWLYAAVDVDSKLLLNIEMFSSRETDTRVLFLHGLNEKPSEAESLVDAVGYPTTLFRLNLSGRLDNRTRKPHRKVDLDLDNMNQPLSNDLDGQSTKYQTLASAVRVSR